jgi:hypothetical protein
MKKSEELIKNFYFSFAKKDYQSMQKCYHENALFSDPVFVHLERREINAMWHMLCEAGKDLMIEYSGIGAYDNSVRATWKAIYTFGKTGRIVHNIIQSSFVLKDDLIISHTDQFDFWKWSKMAFGTNGALMGWSDFFKEKVRGEATRQLNKFIEKHPQYK